MAESNDFVGQYFRYPESRAGRLAEGGRRLKNITQESRTGEPLVTVVTVCFNSAKTIEQAIRSVLGQTYSNIEYVIVDGASSDATLEIIRKYETRIDYYVSEPDDGLYYAMNKGLELAQGEYVLFLNSDDWYTLDAVESLVKAKDYSGCDFVSALADYVDEKAGATKTLRAMPFDSSQYLRMSIRHETMLISKEIYNRIGPYDTQYKILSDREYAARLFDRECTHHEVHRPLLKFRTTGVSNTNRELLRTEQDLILANEFPFLSPDERRRLNNHADATPETFVTIANSHLEHPKFVKACRAFLVDHKANHGKKWQSANTNDIGAKKRYAYPKISVILPFYNARDSIEASLKSVLAQTLSEIEIVCVDDCAIDDSLAVIEDYARRDRRIRTIKNPRNLGLGASRNAGIRAACGQYIFHIDPDDTLPRNALETLYKLATAHGSELVKGAFRADQIVHGRPTGNGSIKYPCGISDGEKINTSLAERPALLQSTEGHWSVLYLAEFAETTPYPTDLKMGQDSIFLVNAMKKAHSITLTPQVVYNYQTNPRSAMNAFSARKCFDEIEWRRRAWHVLEEAGHGKIGDRLLYSYWNPALFDSLPSILSKEEQLKFFQTLNAVFEQTDFRGYSSIQNQKIKTVFDEKTNGKRFHNHEGRLAEIKPPIASRRNKLRVALFSTRDHGGAGLASKRCLEALHRNGQQAELLCYIADSTSPHIQQMPPSAQYSEGAADKAALNRFWRDRAVLTHQENEHLRARELFSKTGAVVDYTSVKSLFDEADIIHFHWVVGLFDFVNASEILGNRPVVWTLHDMNPFTGGCHYTEGCVGYEQDCKSCPLLCGSELANQYWRQKQYAYRGLQNLHIVCPSQWLADKAAESSLFGNRPIHVIPNPLPIDKFYPVNKFVARRRLGLPLDKKLILFGADSLANKRKGGELLVGSVRRLAALNHTDKVEGVVFGASDLEIGVKTHSMGHISDAERLALVYSAADVFAFPSLEDNAPMTIAEAMLCGTTPVAYPVGNVPELVAHRETGYIARYKDIEDFADGLAWALEQPRSGEALARSVRCATKVRRHNDPDRSAKAHIALYESIVSH